jgi:hypothetical protein
LTPPLKFFLLFFIQGVYMAYAIIRKGAFGECGKTKLYYSCLGAFIGGLSVEYWQIFWLTSILWGFIEYLLVLTRTRIIEPLKIGGYKLNRPASAILRGGQEGGFVTIFSLITGDFLENKGFGWWILIVIGLFFMFVKTKTRRILFKRKSEFNLYRKSSQRIIFTFKTNSVMFMIFSGNFYYLYNCSSHDFMRIMRFMTVMFFLASFWTFDQILRGVRGVVYLIKCDNGGRSYSHTRQVLSCDSNYFFCKVSSLETFFILAYDVIIEICSAYLIFFILIRTCTNDL